MQGINHILIKPSKFFWLPNLSLDSLMPNKNNIMKKFFNKVLRKFSSFLDITGYAIILIIINLKTLSKFRNNYGS
ncbi:MAG TPA: hypothetical protein VMW25_00565, partial [Clostridia bacterium]|nr:hypothetical protein [Clostridia bacterium]